MKKETDEPIIYIFFLCFTEDAHLKIREDIKYYRLLTIIIFKISFDFFVIMGSCVILPVLKQLQLHTHTTKSDGRRDIFGTFYETLCFLIRLV